EVVVNEQPGEHVAGVLAPIGPAHNQQKHAQDPGNQDDRQDNESLVKLITLGPGNGRQPPDDHAEQREHDQEDPDQVALNGKVQETTEIAGVVRIPLAVSDLQGDDRDGQGGQSQMPAIVSRYQACQEQQHD